MELPANAALARFKVEQAFAIKSRDLFVVAGDVIEGEVRAGMAMTLPTGAGQTLHVPIHSVEMGRRAGGGIDFVGLTTLARGPGDLELFARLDIVGQVIDVIDPASGR
jgi:hypothetical protein